MVQTENKLTPLSVSSSPDFRQLNSSVGNVDIPDSLCETLGRSSLRSPRLQRERQRLRSNVSGIPTVCLPLTISSQTSPGAWTAVRLQHLPSPLAECCCGSGSLLCVRPRSQQAADWLLPSPAEQSSSQTVGRRRGTVTGLKFRVCQVSAVGWLIIG